MLVEPLHNVDVMSAHHRCEFDPRHLPDRSDTFLSIRNKCLNITTRLCVKSGGRYLIYIFHRLVPRLKIGNAQWQHNVAELRVPRRDGVSTKWATASGTDASCIQDTVLLHEECMLAVES